MPPFTWEAIMEPQTVDRLIYALKLARDEVTQPIVVAPLRPARKAIKGKERQS